MLNSSHFLHTLFKAWLETSCTVARSLCGPQLLSTRHFRHCLSVCSLVDLPLTPLFLRISWVPPPMVWDRGIGQPHLPPAPFPAWSAISHTPAGDDAHFLGVQGRDSDLTYDTEGKKLPFKESRCFPHSHKFPWRRQDLTPKTRQDPNTTKFPISSTWPDGSGTFFLLLFLWFFTASPSPRFLLPVLGAWPKCCLPCPELYDGKPDINHIFPHPVHGLQQMQLQDTGLLLTPEGCEGRSISSPGLRAAQTQHTLARRSPRQNPRTTRRGHQYYFSCGALRLCYGRYCLSDMFFYQKTLSFSEHVF